MSLTEVLAAALALPAEERAELVRGLTQVADQPAPADPLPPAWQRPGPGLLKGMITYMAPDFDAPLEDLQEYMT